ncbi:MAG: SusD/RagB family nutrient-binding outer membrane lipoprotein [Muribaculaceae bacterium]|nr:SusD/RagB family nutrient-binding outer membrane lipoprotein [Muribaculaceae bacterium]
MKLYKSILIGIAGVFSLTSCSDWLDINVNTPTDMSAPYYQRLSWIEYYSNQCYQTSAEIANYISGNYGHNSLTHARGGFSAWNMSNSRSQTVAQSWYNGAVPNFKVYFETAEAAGANHYVGVGHLLYAYGFSVINDFLGESPMSDAGSSSFTPRYDTGKEMFQQIIEHIDLGIEYLQKEQAVGAVSLAVNDYIGNGDVQKWIKFGYLFKARMLNKLLKKGAGNAADLKYDADEILRCLEKAPQSNDDALIINHTDLNDTGSKDQLGINERLDFNTMFSNTGMNNNSYFSKMAEDNLTNFANSGVEDPRADRILPWVRSVKTATTPADIKWSEDGKWRRAKGLDLQSTIRSAGAPYSSTFDATENRWICKNASEARQGDTIYVIVRASSKGYSGNPDLLARTIKGNDNSATSSSFFFRAITPGFFSSYHEACFLKAEVLFRKGDKSGAHTAYTNAVKAHMDLMNRALNVWVNDNPAATNGCPSFQPMTQQEIDNFILNGLGDANSLSLGKIMTQKHITMFCTLETWNDMRRYDFDPEIFFNYDKPGEYMTNYNSQQTKIPMGKYPRRMQINAAETTYNLDMVNAIASKVPGANVSYAGSWQYAPEIWTVPVWWDSEQD